MELVKIEFGTSLFYYIYLVLCIGAFVGLYFLLRHKSEKVKYWALFGILAGNFVLHFLKLAFPQYSSQSFPEIVRKCSFENICAVSTLIFPFIYISKWKAGKDYMFYLGSVSGLLGCFAPMPAIGLEFYQLETIRYYICHAGIWIVPVLMVVLGIHKLNYRRIWKTYVIYFAVLGTIIVNELILIRIGWVETSSLEEFFDASERDMGYAIGLPESMEGVGKFVLWLTPKAWKDPYVPILWEFFPLVIFGGLYMVALSAYWEHDRMKADFLFLKDKAVHYYKIIKAKFSKNDTTDKEPAEEEGKEEKTEATDNE